MPTFRFSTKPLTPARWADFEALFGSKGAPSYCWCMAFRPIDDRSAATNADRKAAMADRVRRRVPVGLIAYLDGAPAGWCSVGPRTSFARLSDRQDDDEPAIWSITCFFIRRDVRGQGLSAKLLDAAIAFARKRGGRIVEAYPVDPDSPSYRHMGFVPLFAEHDFVAAGKTGKRRHVMRLAL